MAFDISPATTSSNRTVPNCVACPVQACPAASGAASSSWREMIGLLGPQAAGATELMKVGQPLSALYSVRAGCVKSYTLDAQGNERVRAFHFPGDLVGLEALGSVHAQASAAPVSSSQVCAIPVAELQKRLGSNATLSAQVLAKTQHDLRQALALTGEYTADQRVAAFLVHVNARIGSNGVIRLPMTRREIGSYLRLATETVCRVLARFEQKGWLTCADKRVTLHDLESLEDVAEPVGLSVAPMRLAAAA